MESISTVIEETSEDALSQSTTTANEGCGGEVCGGEGDVTIGNKTIYINKQGRILKVPGKVARSPAQLAALQKGRDKLRERREALGHNVKPNNPEDTEAAKVIHEKKLLERREKQAAKEKERLTAILNAQKSVEELRIEREALEVAKQAEMERVRAIREFREAQRIEMEKQHKLELESIAEERRIRKEQRQKTMIEQLTLNLNEKVEELHRKTELERQTRRNEKAQKKVMNQFNKSTLLQSTLQEQSSHVPHFDPFHTVNTSQRSPAIKPPVYAIHDPSSLAISSNGTRVLKPFVLRGFECDSR